MRSTLAALRDHAARNPGKAAVTDGNEALSYGDLLDRSSAIARLLQRERVRTVALALDNGPAWIAADLAAQMACAAAVPLPGFFSNEQLAHALCDSEADALLVDAPALKTLDRAALHSAVERLDGGLYLVRTALRAEPRAAIAKVSYTSGTTGRPKGVALTQSAMDTVAESLWAATAELSLGRHLCLLPLATLLENVGGVYAPLRGGAEVIAPRLEDIGFGGGSAFDVGRFLACLHRHRPHSVILLPQMLQALVTAVERGAARPESLRFIAVGGARVAQQLLERAERAGLPVYEGYGLTECSSVVALNTPGARRPGSVGRVLPHARVHIDPVGQIHVSGAAVSGYLGDTGAPSPVATGDLGHVDGDGFLYIDGRRKNVFITSFGRNVSPEWVEAELTGAGAIRQAAVFGEARPWNAAVLVPASDAVTDGVLESAVEAANRRLPDYARVSGWLRAPEPFSAANGLLTSNGRNRRDAIWRRYRAAVESRYCAALGQTA